jgi:hypothetical protein
MNTKIPTSKCSYTVLPPLTPPTTSCGKLQKNLNLSHKLLHLFRRHRIHGHEAAEKAQAFANHFAIVFQPHPSDYTSTPEATLTSLLKTPFQLEPPVNRLKRSGVHAIIHNLPPNKSPGYYFMTGKILKELSPSASNT